MPMHYDYESITTTMAKWTGLYPPTAVCSVTRYLQRTLGSTMLETHQRDDGEEQEDDEGHTADDTHPHPICNIWSCTWKTHNSTCQRSGSDRRPHSTLYMTLNVQGTIYAFLHASTLYFWNHGASHGLRWIPLNHQKQWRNRRRN